MNPALFLFLHGCLAAANGAQASAPPPAATTATVATGTADLALLEEVRRIATRVESLRGARFPSRVVAVRAAEPGRRAAWELRASRILPQALRAARGRAWADLGLGTPDLPSRVAERLAKDLQVAAVDPGTGQLLVAAEALKSRAVVRSTSESDSSSDETESDSVEKGARADMAMVDLFEFTGIEPDEVLVAHTLVHLLQHARPATDRTTDRILTEAAWSEGEANLVAVRYIFEALGVGEDVVLFNIDPEEFLTGTLMGDPLAELPVAARPLVRFVSQEGYARVVEAYRKGGWKAVDRARASRICSRDLLHPDRIAPEARPAPGPPPLSSLVLTDDDSLGEQGVIALVSTLTGKDDLALAAGDGWTGDSLQRWEHVDGPEMNRGVTVWETAWTTPAEAEEFAYAFGRSVEDGLGANRPDPAATVWAVSDRIFRLLRRESRVTVRVASLELDRAIEKPVPPKIKKT